jgi:hypothetical protein
MLEKVETIMIVEKVLQSGGKVFIGDLKNGGDIASSLLNGYNQGSSEVQNLSVSWNLIGGQGSLIRETMLSNLEAKGFELDIEITGIFALNPDKGDGAVYNISITNSSGEQIGNSLIYAPSVDASSPNEQRISGSGFSRDGYISIGRDGGTINVNVSRSFLSYEAGPVQHYDGCWNIYFSYKILSVIK